MTRVVVDASALAALAFREPEGDAISRRLEGAMVFAPALLKFELTNTAWKKIRRQPADGVAILAALTMTLGREITWQDIDAADVLLVAQATGCSAYDASYLWLAGALGADLVTLDAELARAAETMTI